MSSTPEPSEAAREKAREVWLQLEKCVQRDEDEAVIAAALDEHAAQATERAAWTEDAAVIADVLAATFKDSPDQVVRVTARAYLRLRPESATRTTLAIRVMAEELGG